ncbi:MAG: glycoside hydrolase family 9 protein, partial [Cyanobacteria bacterium J06632_3]
MSASVSDQTAEPVQPAHIYAVSPNVIAVEIPAPSVTRGRQIAYEPLPTDVLRTKRDHNQRDRTQVYRAGIPVGILVGPEKDILYTYDRVSPSSFNLGSADAPERYSISALRDPNYLVARSPVAVFRKSKPVNFSQEANGRRRWPAAHTLYLSLPSPMTEGKTYQLKFSGLGVVDSTFVYTPTETRSEAVHVSQLGFRPDDIFKVGYLSTWMGNGGGFSYPPNLTFTLQDTRTRLTAYKGIATLRRISAQTEDDRNRDYTLSEVHQLDFSDFSRPGQYRLCVQGVGCSFDFDITHSVWDEAFWTAARGFYHQRSGIAIGPPHSQFTRPRAFHPDDGLKIYESTATLLEVKMGIGDLDAFETLTAGKTDNLIPDAWGGYFDAGDWDRRIHHLTIPRQLMELHNLFPEHFQSIDLNLPESNNSLPDILDEALWSLDFFRQLQTSDGGIRGGVESAAHPRQGEASWQESLTVMAYAPDIWSSYVYAGVAARAAFTLQAYDTDLAKELVRTYTDSALQAMAYAEANYDPDDYLEGKRLYRVADRRNLAALELYRLTKSQRWHSLFLETTVFKEPDVRAVVPNVHDQMDAAFLYASLNHAARTVDSIRTADTENTAIQQTEEPSDGESLGLKEQSNEQSIKQSKKQADSLRKIPVNEVVQLNAKRAFLRQVNQLVRFTKTTAFGWSKPREKVPLGWRNGLGAPASVDI